MQYTQKIAPSEVYAIMFTTIYMLHFSLPGLLGNIFGGMIYEIVKVTKPNKADEERAKAINDSFDRYDNMPQYQKYYIMTL